MRTQFTVLLKMAAFASPGLSLCSGLSLLLICCVSVSADEAAPTQLRALLITGQSNHNWQVSAPILQTILEDTGIFLVDVAQTPPAGADMSGFMPQFAAYDVVVLNYTGDAWSETINAAFMEYVSNGGGVVVVHEANNAFPEWPEYNEIIGLGGWGNRDERHGPYVYWRDDRVIYDMTPGPGGAHGRQHKFEIIHRQPEHPITRGLPEAWLHNTDELYHHLRGPARDMTFLATAWSDPETGGTGEHEPVMFTINYGEGRVFQTTLGHAGPTAAASPSHQCAGFIVTLQRGAEWAATGDVTQPIPNDFPGKDIVRIRPRFTANSLDMLVAELVRYKYNDSLEPLVLLEELTRKRMGARDSVADLEKAYIELLQSAEATHDAKFFACKQLSLVGGNASVPALAEMLLDIDLAYMARYALQRIPAPMSLRVLQEALPLVCPESRAGIITSLGERRDLQVSNLIGVAVHDRDERVVAAALRALAKVESPEASAVLYAAIEREENEMKRLAEAMYVKSGFTLLNRGHTRSAENVFATAYAILEDNARARAAALRGRIAAAGSQLEGNVIIEALQGDDAIMHEVAAAAVRDVSHTTLQFLAGKLAELEASPTVLLLTALSELKVFGVTPQIIEIAQSDNETIRIAALRALATIGDAEATLFLVERAATAAGEEQAAARHSLSRLKGASPIILKALREDDPKLRSELLKAVVARQVAQATPMLIERLTEATAEERLELLDALTQIAEPEHLDMIIPLLLSAEAQEDSMEMAGMVATVADRAASGEVRVASLQAALETETEPTARRNIYAALGKIADDSALPLLEAGLDEPDAAARLVIVEALAAWPTDAPLATLRAALERFKGADEGAIALSGYIRLVGLNENRAPEETTAMYVAALPFAERGVDKLSCIIAIGKTGAADALPVLYDALADDDADVARAAARALGGWPDAAPMTRLETLATDGPDHLKPEALRGYFQLIGINHELSEEEVTQRYRQAFTLATGDAERKRLMAGLAGAETPGALGVVLEHLDNPELKNEAEVAAVKIAAQVAGSHPASVRQALEQVNAVTESDFVRDEIKKVYERIARFEDYITAWEVAGPYTLGEGDTDKIFDTPFAPETDDADKGINWRMIPVGTNDRMPYLVELDKALGGNNRAAYLRSNIWCNETGDVLLEIGSDDGNKVWLNGELVNEANVTRPVAPAQDAVEIKLQQGWNSLLIKVTQGSGEWSACARIRAADGSALEGIYASVRAE